MKFRTEIEIPGFSHKLVHGNSIISLGSCFSVNIGEKLSYYGFDVLNNPFGTLFHPLSIANVISQSIHPKQGRFCQRDSLYFSYDVHSSIHAQTESDLANSLAAIHQQFLSKFTKATLCIITFGSAWGYYKDGELVANCHKMPAKLFKKELTDFTEMHTRWIQVIHELKQLNPSIHFLFSVSPVRHLKDGTVENSLSKARLIELAHSLNQSYFPAFELIMDDLRDYRFYKDDLLHPTPFAIDYVFEKFAHALIDAEASQLFPLINKLRRAEQHHIMQESESARVFSSNTQAQIQQFIQDNPSVVWK